MSVDRVGVLYRRQTDPETPPEALPGWHVNVTPEEVEARPELAVFVITPSRLRRVWAGDDPTDPDLTVALRFADEAEAGSFFPAEPETRFPA